MHACMLISNIAGSDPARRKSVSLIPGAHARPNPPDKWILSQFLLLLLFFFHSASQSLTQDQSILQWNDQNSNIGRPSRYSKSA